MAERPLTDEEIDAALADVRAGAKPVKPEVMYGARKAAKEAARLKAENGEFGNWNGECYDAGFDIDRLPIGRGILG
jgi:hypothetical protein